MDDEKINRKDLKEKTEAGDPIACYDLGLTLNRKMPLAPTHTLGKEILNLGEKPTYVDFSKKVFTNSKFYARIDLPKQSNILTMGIFYL